MENHPMNLVPDLLPLPASLENALRNFAPNPDTLKWTTTGAGGFVEGPLSMARKCGYVVDVVTRASHANAVALDLSRRGIVWCDPNPHLLDPDFNGLAKIKKTLYNTWDALHFSVATLRDLFIEHGAVHFGQRALELVSSYFVSKNVKYLRCEDSTDPALMYGNGSRTRCAARCVQALVQAHDIVRHAPDPGHAIKAKNYLRQHVERIYHAWPLAATVEKENGSPEKPACRVFMLGHLWEALRLLVKSDIFSEADPTVELTRVVMERIEGMLRHAILPQFGTACLAYDLAVIGTGNDVTVSIHEKTLTTPQPTGIGGVNQWVYPAMCVAAPDFARELREDAIRTKFDQKFPLAWIERIQERLP
jgi:hypothetical protein